MALVRQKLYQSKTLSLINLKNYLKELSENVVQTFSPGRLSITTHLDLDNIIVSIDEAVPCGLIINELILNSLKHGYPDKETGRISISMKLRGHDAVFTYADNGVGLSGPVIFDNLDNLGLQTVKSIAEHQLEGSMKIDGKNGFCCDFQFDTSNMEERVFL